VGLVWFATAVREGESARAEAHEMRYAPLGRSTVRRFAAHTGLDLLRRAVQRL
jgi:nicotinamide mononucleotide (NMN) deamidase PncC